MSLTIAKNISLSPLPFTNVQWASEREKCEIIRRNQSNGRQTMNLRVMKNAKIALVKDGEIIIGHAGIDHSFSPNYPEFFSFFVHKDYRKRGIGNSLEKFICEYALKIKLNFLYLRVAGESDKSLDRFRIKTGCFEEVSLPFKFSSLCQRCELFGKSCKTQKYLKLNVLKRLEQLH
jgi:N-acetylglutamate synthase-like GNAT family acetyltransferase